MPHPPQPDPRNTGETDANDIDTAPESLPETPRETPRAGQRDAQRETLRDLRRTIDAGEQRRRATEAAIVATQLDRWPTSLNIAVYSPFDGELDPGPLSTCAQDAGKATFVPVLAEGCLKFARFDDATSWRTNRYGISEPDNVDDQHLIDAAHIDIAFIPAVAADLRGNRIGMGAGWYDRTFEFTRTSNRSDRPLLVAFVHAEQVVEEFAPRPWDVPVDAIVTPNGLIVVDGPA